MINRSLLLVSLAMLSALTACGGGQADDSASASEVRARVAGVSSEATAQAAIGGIGGTGVQSNIGGIGGTGVQTNIGGIGGTGIAKATALANIGGIGGTGVQTDIGGIGGTGIAKATALANIGGIGGTGVQSNIGGIGGTGVQTNIGGIGGTGIASVSGASACGLSQVVVTVTALRLNQNAAAGTADAGWVDVPLAAPLRLDLLALSTGAALPLELSALPDGVYAQAQLVVAPNGASLPLADATVSTQGVERALSLPGMLRLATAIAVDGGRATGSWTPAAVCQAIGATAAAID